MQENNNNSENNMIKCYFYGSLRESQYNCNAFKRMFGEDSMQYQQTLELEGFQLYSLGSYPMILKDPNGNLVVDEFLVSPEAFESVRSMELGAGYEEEVIDGAYIYYFETNDYKYPIVEHGDWSKYLKERENSYTY